MKIQYLGTAAAEGIPALFCNCDICKKAAKNKGKDLRSRSQAVIDDDLVVDFPPDSYHHMLNNSLNLPSIKNVIITHSHQDHFYPDDILFRGGAFASDVDGVLNLYGNDKVMEKWEKAKEGATWEIDNVVKFNLLKAFEEFVVGDYKITPIPANHDKSENCLIFLIKKNGKTMLYTNDTGLLNEESMNFLKNESFDLLSMDCTMCKQKEGTNHMGIPDNIIMYNQFKEMNVVTDKTKVLVTHFSHNGGMLHADIENAVKDYGFITAYDGMCLEF